MLLLTLAACRQNQPQDAAETENAPAGAGEPSTIAFLEPNIDLGQVREGDTLRHRFVFRNTGHSPLLIQSASASCGCTVPTFPTWPVAPGDTASLLVAFNSRNRVGPNTKTITVYANTQPATTTVQFKVKVVE